MSTTNGTVKKQSNIDLERLTQSDAAWLVNRKASWLREHANLVRRNPDGSYQGQVLVAAMLGHGAPAELSDEHLTAVMRIAESVYELSYAMPGCVRVLREIVKEHGTAGLAAVGQVLLETCEKLLRDYSGCHACETVDQIRARHEAECEGEIAGLADRAARRDMRCVEWCDRCHKYRWGREWKEQPLPRGYVLADGSTRCPEHQ